MTTNRPSDAVFANRAAREAWRERFPLLPDDYDRDRGTDGAADLMYAAALRGVRAGRGLEAADAVLAAANAAQSPDALPRIREGGIDHNGDHHDYPYNCLDDRIDLIADAVGTTDPDPVQIEHHTAGIGGVDDILEVLVPVPKGLLDVDRQKVLREAGDVAEEAARRHRIPEQTVATSPLRYAGTAPHTAVEGVTFSSSYVLVRFLQSVRRAAR